MKQLSKFDAKTKPASNHAPQFNPFNSWVAIHMILQVIKLHTNILDMQQTSIHDPSFILACIMVHRRVR